MYVRRRKAARMSRPDLPNELANDLARLLMRYRVRSGDAAPVLELLAAAYSAPGRHYHNLEHIGEMLGVARRLTTVTDNAAPIQLAIWFHDAVYDPRAKDNEACSAELAVTSLGPIGVPRSDLEVVTCLILATEHLADDRPPADRSTAIVLDADLAILGADAERYRRYAADIRKEYAWVSEDEYRRGRANVLEHFLRRERIYWTDMMYEECEEQARANLQVEQAALARVQP